MTASGRYKRKVMVSWNKQNIKPKRNPINDLSDWPECYYSESDPFIKKEMLEKCISEHPDSEEEKARYAAFKKRYTLSRSGFTDHFTEAWIQLDQICRRDIVVVKKKNKKIMDQCIEKLGLTDQKLQEYLQLEWKNMADVYIHAHFDKNTRNKYLTIIPQRDNAIIKYIATGIEQAGRYFPECFGLEEEFSQIYQIMIEAFEDITKVSYKEVISM